MAEGEKKRAILAKVIIEMLGAPKEHIESTLKDYVEKLRADKKIEVVKEDLAPAKQQEKLFSTFAELDIWFSSSRKLVDFCFDSMPSSVEILEPQEIKLDASELSSTLNDLQAKIHSNDMIVKTLKAKQEILDRNAKSVVHNFIYFMLKDGEKELEEIAKSIGLKPEHAKPFLAELVKAGKISEKEGKYGRKEEGNNKKD